MNITSILQDLKGKGCRTTPLRMALLEILLQEKEPLSVQKLLAELTRKDLHPNQASLYRQLETLVEHKVVDRVVLDPKVQLFEIAHEHHHHFVCKGCNDVQDVHSDDLESAFHKFENILKKKGLFVGKHELTFFGECQSCN
jgi:Fe2+ or Zn2+ uptake regulation protein